MIDIESVEKLENKAMLERIEKEKLRQEEDRKNQRETHTRVMLQMEAGRCEAEKDMPRLISQLQDEIAYAIRQKKYNLEFKCGNNGYQEEWKLMHIKIMLCQMLPLKGLACKLSDQDFRSVIVSW